MEPLAATPAASAFAPTSPILLPLKMRVVSEPLAATPAASALAPSWPILIVVGLQQQLCQGAAGSHASRQRLRALVADVVVAHSHSSAREPLIQTILKTDTFKSFLETFQKLSRTEL